MNFAKYSRRTSSPRSSLPFLVEIHWKERDEDPKKKEFQCLEFINFKIYVLTHSRMDINESLNVLLHPLLANFINL